MKERKRLNLTLLEETKIHRFRYHRADYLAELEARWEAALSGQIASCLTNLYATFAPTVHS